MKNRFLLILIVVLSTFGAMAQTSIEQCYEAARQNYPLIKQLDLIAQTREYNLKNVASSYYPQIGLSARATYQTDVTSVPVPNFKSMPKDQYQIIAEVNQSIWDGGVTRAQKRGVEASSDIEAKRLEVDLYTLNERVNNLYFGILMLEEQLKINMLLDEELKRNLNKVENYISNGVANSVDADVVKVEILNNRQRRVAIEAAKKSYTDMLSAMVGFEVRELVKPSKPSLGSLVINTPEIELFEAQIKGAEVQKDAIVAKNFPKLSVFAQGAYGNPGLNMLAPGFTPYAIGGVRLSWNFSGLYNRKNDLGKIEVQKKSIESQREAFLYNTNLQLTQYEGELKRASDQMVEDDYIIRLRGNIKRSAEAKVEGGTMSVTDMLREVTAENTAIQNKAVHDMELLMTMYSIKHKINN